METVGTLMMVSNHADEVLSDEDRLAFADSFREVGNKFAAGRDSKLALITAFGDVRVGMLVAMRSKQLDAEDIVSFKQIAKDIISVLDGNV